MRKRNRIDCTFVYTPAVSTDIRKTFRRLERERKKAEKAAAERAAATSSKVAPIKAGGKP